MMGGYGYDEIMESTTKWQNAQIRILISIYHRLGGKAILFSDKFRLSQAIEVT